MRRFKEKSRKKIIPFTKKTAIICIGLWLSFTGPLTATDNQIAILKRTSDVFHKVAKTAIPAVVSIQTSGRVVQNDETAIYSHYMRQLQNRENLGSGVIISPNGYIITNFHVIEKMDQIKVVLSDNTTYQATIVGIDKKTDLAVLKIEAENLPIIPYANSKDTKVGQWAIAVGNPLDCLGL